eukprot:8133678-Alexandrium_andersonii.AAC.1
MTSRTSALATRTVASTNRFRYSFSVSPGRRSARSAWARCQLTSRTRLERCSLELASRRFQALLHYGG